MRQSTVEGQKFCKACGTNIQLINDAIKSGDSAQAPFGIDVDALTRNAKEFAESWKKTGTRKVVGLKLDQSRVDSIPLRNAKRAEGSARKLGVKIFRSPRSTLSYSCSTTSGMAW